MLNKLVAFFQPFILYIYLIHIVATDLIRKYDWFTKSNNLIVVLIYTVLIIAVCSMISWIILRFKSLFHKIIPHLDEL